MKYVRSLSLALGTWISAQAALAGPFVQTRGNRFVLDGEDFAFQGTNYHHFGLLDGKSDKETYEHAQQYADRGLRVIRFWGFSCQDVFYGTPLISGVKDGRLTYNESAWRRLDTALDAARVAGLKVIVPLVNFEPELCGMDWWTRRITGNSDKHLFYTDSRIRDAYKAHAQYFLTRVNTRYEESLGRRIAYRDDPTIMSIELANEPHTEDYYEKQHGLPPGSLTYDWLKEMSGFVRSLDRNHLISSGEEGYKVSHSGDTSKNAWIHNGSKGIDFERNIQLPDISFATVHIYPDNWNIPSYDMEWVRKELVRDRAQIAHAAGKPIVMEESGFARGGRFGQLGYSQNPSYWLRRIYSFANQEGYAGTMVWQALPYGQGNGDYDFSWNDPQFAEIEQQAYAIRHNPGK